MKRYRNFILRTLNLLVILGVLWQYQTVAAGRASAVEQRQKEIAEVEAYNASVVQAEAEQEAVDESGYRDGVYEGSAYGFGDLITVAVTLKDGRMTDISVVRAEGEDKPYYTQSLTVLDRMMSAQSTAVDTVSGATLTSEGMIGAVEDALGKAAK